MRDYIKELDWVRSYMYKRIDNFSIWKDLITRIGVEIDGKIYILASDNIFEYLDVRRKMQ